MNIFCHVRHVRHVESRPYQYPRGIYLTLSLDKRYHTFLVANPQPIVRICKAW